MSLAQTEMRADTFLKLVSDPVVNISFSQFGEDFILETLFYGLRDGFYVDIGAHHPRRLSNTYLLHCAGWRGINVDLDDSLMAKFRAERPSDIKVIAALTDTSQSLDVSMFNEPAVNTLSPARAEEYKHHWTVIEARSVQRRTFSDILACYLPADRTIDLLNVDVEGLDLNVL